MNILIKETQVSLTSFLYSSYKFKIYSYYMFGNYKKSYIKRDNLYIIFFGTKKENKNSFIELINVLYFIK